MSAYRRGYVAVAWTGPFCNRYGRPILFSSIDSARRFLARTQFEGVGCGVYACRTRPGSNGLPDYIIERRLLA